MLSVTSCVWVGSHGCEECDVSYLDVSKAKPAYIAREGREYLNVKVRLWALPSSWTEQILGSVPGKKSALERDVKVLELLGEIEYQRYQELRCYLSPCSNGARSLSPATPLPLASSSRWSLCVFLSLRTKDKPIASRKPWRMPVKINKPQALQPPGPSLAYRLAAKTKLPGV